MIWDRTTIQRVRNLRAKVEVDLTLDEDLSSKMDALRKELLKDLLNMAYSLGTMLDERDIVLSRETAIATPYRAIFIARWAPWTKEVELLGGPSDGVIYTVRDVNSSLNVALQPTDLNSLVIPTKYPHKLEPMYVRYSLAGWSEKKRYWIFEHQS